MAGENADVVLGAFSSFEKGDLPEVPLGDLVLLDFGWVARGTGSGIESRTQSSAAFRVGDGLIMEGHYRWSRPEALEAAGLSQGGS